MKSMLSQLKETNQPLYLFGWLNIIFWIICLFGIAVSDMEILGINAWIKPSKFFISAAIYSWTMLWYIRYLPTKKANKAFSWMIILVFTFENFYILWRASKGELSHFNITSATTIVLFSLMGVAISILTAWTAFIGFQFCYYKLPELPRSYHWGIRIGILSFVFFAFSGFIMAGYLQHTVGAADGGAGIPYLNWSKQHGDLRIAHFLGMHALQLFPLLGYYILKKTSYLLPLMAVYIAANFYVLLMALEGKSLFW
ncbi:MAG: hypothetical protein ACJAT1_000791 [Marivirga sp.]|jgi:hypothetical protein